MSSYTKSRWSEPMRPVAQPDGHDAPWLVCEPVPGMAAVVDDGLGGLEDPVRQPVVAHELPHVPHRVEDRKSTRLNSSHANISYAVFCLKKKQKHTLLNSPL